MSWLKQLLSDGEQPSTMRVLLLVIVLVWAVLCIRQNTFVVPDMKVIGFLGTLLGAKTLQSFSENLSAPKTSNTEHPTPNIQ